MGWIGSLTCQSWFIIDPIQSEGADRHAERNRVSQVLQGPVSVMSGFVQRKETLANGLWSPQRREHLNLAWRRK